MKELDPIQIINKTLSLWWVIAIAILLGGLLGFGFSFWHTPIYEATARFYVTVDISKYGDRDISERDEDLALAGIQDTLWSNEVLQAIAQESQSQKLPVNMATLIHDATTERGNAYWYLRYRSSDPAVARKFVNIWAQQGYAALLTRIADHQLVDYVKFSPPALASLPTAPVEYGRNKLMVAGVVLGLIAGIFFSNLLASRVGQ
jgi:capsular polysaccharide biosynthesis protein